jgi:hypothetical protein
MAVLGDGEVVKELNVHCTKMTMEDAILLFYTGNYTEAQWDSMVLAVNKLMKPGFDFEQHMVSWAHVCASLSPSTMVLKKRLFSNGRTISGRLNHLRLVYGSWNGMQRSLPFFLPSVENLQAVLKALSVVHEQTNQPKADLETLQAAVDAFASNVRIFEWDKTPAPFRYRLKFYDHAIMDMSLRWLGICKSRAYHCPWCPVNSSRRATRW